MKTNQWNKFFLAGCLVLLASIVHAQQEYKYKAVLTKVDTSGFYRITIPPKVAGKCQNSLLTDLRILDDNGGVVPYVSQRDVPVKYRGRFIEFEKLPPGNDNVAVLIKSPPHLLLQRIYLVIKNNNVKRIVNLSGSDDGKKWYLVTDSTQLINAENNGRGYFEYPIIFPPSNYQYYRISACDKNKGPINILKAGYYKNDLLEGNYDELPKPVITQLDSAKTSYVKINFDDSYIPDKLHIEVSGAKYYRRDVALFSYQKPTSNKVTGNECCLGIIMSDTLASNKDGNFYGCITSNALLLEIHNQDNPPLKVTSATAYQLRISVLCYLEAGKKYHLTFGNSFAEEPHYDLAFFKDSINAAHNSVKVGDIVSVAPINKINNKPGSNFAYILWGTIAIVLLVMAFFTYKIANEVKAKDS